ncbi:uncharacterized protein DDB_G0280205-like [Eriocheir sinensis]|uniref:uncharacterized protein DDB_G0280205-like n=1 Tax=Eriocheir sinensis TaxID=95602 RepID=UPI0021C8263E|nr:uncharacterized protein DDB_G0280205-like [Eriocheir sinensis]
MDQPATRRIGKKDQRMREEEEEEEEVEEVFFPLGGTKPVDKLREYYDEAKTKLRSYLSREDDMGTGSSSPRGVGGGMGVEGGTGGTVFQQRPPHCRLEGRTEPGGGEFTDISYSDLGFIIIPSPKKLTINNNYKTSVDGNPPNSTSANHSTSSSNPSSTFTSHASLPNSPTPTPSEGGYMDHHDCDPVSSEVESGHASSTSTSTVTTSPTTSPPITTPPALHRRSSNSSFPRHLPGSNSPTCDSPTLMDDLKLEEITT